MLAKRPQVGHWRTDLASEPLRFWPIYSYLIIYRPDSKPIEIVGFFMEREIFRRLCKRVRKIRVVTSEMAYFVTSKGGNRVMQLAVKYIF